MFLKLIEIHWTNIKIRNQSSRLMGGEGSGATNQDIYSLDIFIITSVKLKKNFHFHSTKEFMANNKQLFNAFDFLQRRRRKFEIKN